MPLIDSNLIIYFAKPEFSWLSDDILTNESQCSVVSKIEVLGYHKITVSANTFFELYFENITILPLTVNIIDEAIRLGQQKKMSLGDTVIAATALVHGLVLYTHNTADFDHIEGLNIFDPLTHRFGE